MRKNFLAQSFLLALSLLAILSLAGCNLPTQANGPSNGEGEPTEVDPAAVSTERPTPPPPTAVPTIAATQDGAAGPTATPEPGLRAVYTDDGNLWAVELGSAPRQLTNEAAVGELRISDDGQWIAYVIRDPNTDTAQVFSIQFDGSNQQVLLNPGSFDILYPLGDFLHHTLARIDFLPNSHTLLLNTRGVFEGPGIVNNDDLLSIDAVSGQISLLLLPGEGGDFTASPSGDQVAIVRPDSLGFVNSDGTGERQEVLTFPQVITYSEFLYNPVPIWVEDQVLLAVPQQDPFFAEEPGTVWRVNGEVEVVARPQGDLYVLQRTRPIISPDGSKLAMFRPTGAQGEQALVILDLATGEDTVYDSGATQWYGWSPDSNGFAYTKETGLDLFLGALGAEPESLGSGTGFRWVSDEEFLYFAGVPETWTLTLGSVSGASTPLAMSSDEFPVFDFAE